jgi:hypothetical protein
MDLKALRRLPEERISALLSIPAIILNFGAGLDRSTFANYSEAREAAYESHVIPLQRIIASVIRQQLLRSEGQFKNSERLQVRHDISGVRVLQDDQNKLYARLNIAYHGDWMKRSEVRSAVGLEVSEEDKVYKSQTVVKQAAEKPENQKPTIPDAGT